MLGGVRSGDGLLGSARLPKSHPRAPMPRRRAASFMTPKAPQEVGCLTFVIYDAGVVFTYLK